MAELERKHLLLLVALGVVSKSFVKSTFGANVSLILLLSVGLYYWRVTRRSQTIYDDIARMQVEAAAKLDKLSGLGDGKVSDMDLHVRKTQFQLRPDDVSVITDRMHKYSRKFGGSLAERRKFLRKNNRKNRKSNDSDDDDVDINAAASRQETIANRKSSLESTVEAAVNETL